MSAVVDVGRYMTLVRRVALVQQTGAGALAVLAMTRKMANLAASLRAKVDVSDGAVARTARAWDASMAGLQLRLAFYDAAFTRGRRISDPATGRLVVFAQVTVPLILGQWTNDLATAVGPETNGLRRTKDGWAGPADALTSASLVNQVIELARFSNDQSEAFGQSVLSAMTDVALQLERSAPGEEPTFGDAAVRAAGVVSSGAASVLATAKGAATTVLLVAGGVLGAYLVYRFASR